MPMVCIKFEERKYQPISIFSLEILCLRFFPLFKMKSIAFSPATIGIRRCKISVMGPVFQSTDYSEGDWKETPDWEKSAASWEEQSTPEDTLQRMAEFESQEADFIKQQQAKDARVADMKSRGLADEAIAAYTGFTPVEEEENDLLDKFMEETSSGAAAFGMVVEDIDYTKMLSHQHVEVDKVTGEPMYIERFVYVDEYTCIGCTNCACVAKNTFFMEDDYGRARVFLQGGDDDETIQTAVETCPVDCIHFVPWAELKSLEKERSEMAEINYKARLVGGDGAIMARNGGGMQQISGNSGYRCNNCPSLGCAKCPMYGVGENPYYLERKNKKNAARKKKLEEEAKKQNSQRFDL